MWRGEVARSQSDGEFSNPHIGGKARQAADIGRRDEQGPILDFVSMGDKLRFLMTVEFRRPVVRALLGIFFAVRNRGCDSRPPIVSRGITI